MMYMDVLPIYAIPNIKVPDLSVLLRQGPQAATGGPMFASYNVRIAVCLQHQISSLTTTTLLGSLLYTRLLPQSLAHSRWSIYMGNEYYKNIGIYV